MYHVDNSTGVPVMPQPSPVTSETELFFTEGGNGVPPTFPGPDWFNIIQSELINILRAAGLDPDKMDNTQILAALKKLFLSRSNPFGDIKADGAAAIATALSNLGLGDLGTASRRNVGTGANQIPDMSSFASTLNMPGVARFPGGFKLMWVLGNTNSSGAADVVFPTSFDVFGLGAIAIERNPYAWGAGISNTWAIQLSTLTKTGVQAICREDNGSRISAVENAGCIVFAWGK